MKNSGTDIKDVEKLTEKAKEIGKKAAEERKRKEDPVVVIEEEPKKKKVSFLTFVRFRLFLVLNTTVSLPSSKLLRYLHN